MSQDASGTIAGQIVFSKWKGRNYVRQHVIPANPKTDKQTRIRTLLSLLVAMWKSEKDDIATNWRHLADLGKFSTFNAYTRENLMRWKNGLLPITNPNNPDYTTDSNLTQITYTITNAIMTITVAFTNSQYSAILIAPGTLATADLVIANAIAAAYTTIGAPSTTINIPWNRPDPRTISAIALKPDTPEVTNAVSSS
jgi:hypothetical protein